VPDLLNAIEGQDQQRRIERDLLAKLRQRDADLADLRKLLDFTTQIDQAKLAPPRWLTPPKSRKSPGVACAMLTDAHFDEIVNPAEIDWANAYNRDIALLRLRAFVAHTITLSRDYLSGIEWAGGVLFNGGDLFSGNIHDELKETNAATLYASVVYWIEHLEAAILALADHFGRLHVPVTIGNHGRATKKPIAKRRAQDNIEWLIWRFVERDLRADKRLTFAIPDGADTSVTVLNTRYQLTHGDQFRGGSGISGALAPLMLGSHRKSRRGQAMGKPYDVLVMGHFHQMLWLPGVIVGGTLKGTDEYAYLGNFGYEPAQQAFWVTDADHGITLRAPIHVVNRRAEGW
jgi:hypothetical protein